MKEPLGSDEWSASWEKNWYFLDTRTDTVIYPEPHGHFGQPGDFDPGRRMPTGDTFGGT